MDDDSIKQLVHRHWVIAHEFAHVAPIVPRHAIIAGRHCLFVDGRWRTSAADPARLEQLYEDAADRLACDWGFSGEAEIFSQEISEAGLA